MTTEMPESKYMFRLPKEDGEAVFYYHNRGSGDIFARKEGLPSYWQRTYPHYTEYGVRVGDTEGLIRLYKRINKSGLRFPHEHAKSGDFRKAYMAIKTGGFTPIWGKGYLKNCLIWAEGADDGSDEEGLKSLRDLVSHLTRQ